MAAGEAQLQDKLMNIQNVSPSGIQTAPHLPWGSHLAQFFRSGEDLRELLVPYFKAGLENNEQCLLVAGDAFDADQARSALRAAVPDLKKRERMDRSRSSTAGNGMPLAKNSVPRNWCAGSFNASRTR